MNKKEFKAAQDRLILARNRLKGKDTQSAKDKTTVETEKRKKNKKKYTGYRWDEGLGAQKESK